MNIAFTKHVLDNGLDVIVHENHRCPIVAVNVWYHVGSKNERPGHTGFAHLFEHLMFEGSEHHDSGYFPPLQQAGGLLNGSTNADRTNYWEVMPANALELALWMESDRMGYLLPALSDAKFRNQRDVVLNERRQNYENRPYGMVPMAIMAALFPPHHPYHWLTIGASEDLEAASLREVRAFFETYYHPGNASIVVAGDVETERTLGLVQDYFSAIPRGPVPDRPREAASLEGEIRQMMEDRIELPRLYMAWHSPSLFGEGDAVLDLSSDILGGGKSSRLYRALVYDRRLAFDVAAVQSSREMAGFFQVVVTATPGSALAEVEQVISAEIARLAERGPTEAELERAKTDIEAQFIYNLQTVGGFGGTSDQLNSYNTYVGDPGYFDTDLARYQAVTADEVKRWIGCTLDPNRRVVLSAVPLGRAGVALPDSNPVVCS
jgi:zinc protease